MSILGTYKLRVKSVTDAAREIIESIGGTIEPYRTRYFIVSLPSSGNYKYENSIMYEGAPIYIRGFRLVNTSNPEGTFTSGDLEVTLDITREHTK